MKKAEGGQTTVELALVLPLFVMLGLSLVQVGLVVRDQLAVVHAAREAARAASVDPDPLKAEAAAEAVVPGARVRSGARPPVGQALAVEVEYQSPTVVPLIGPLLPDVRLHGRAVMRVER